METDKTLGKWTVDISTHQQLALIGWPWIVALTFTAALIA